MFKKKTSFLPKIKFSSVHFPALIALCTVVLVATIPACRYVKEYSPGNNEPVARFGETYLYRTDLQAMMGQAALGRDSAKNAQFHINTWLTNLIWLQKSDSLLNQSLRDSIEQKAEAYRQTLAANEIENILLRQYAADTSIADTIISAFYEENKRNFILPDHILNVSYLIAPKDAPNLVELKQDLKNAPNDTALYRLKEYCLRYANTYSLSPKWITWDALLGEIPIETKNVADFLKLNKVFATKDAVNLYAIRIYEYALKGNIAPLSYKKNAIKDLLLHQKKLTIAKNLKQRMFDEALQKGEIQIY